MHGATLKIFDKILFTSLCAHIFIILSSEEMNLKKKHKQITARKNKFTKNPKLEVLISYIFYAQKLLL